MAFAETFSLGSYSLDDVIFLLKDVSGRVAEIANEERETLIQSGIHYSEMLPLEYKPSADYLKLFTEMVKENGYKVALNIAIMAEKIWQKKGAKVVLVSLARAGTPIGILVKRYLFYKYKVKVMHYSISIIRGKGFDENALLYIRSKHQPENVQFIDGWTGKGAIAKELIIACQSFNEKFKTKLESDLAVLADTGYCVSLYGTREDFCIPSACLNATVSGLLSRTVHRTDLIGPLDFHGVRFYKEWLKEDQSNFFLDSIAHYFANVFKEALCIAEKSLKENEKPDWRGLLDVQFLQKRFQINNQHMLKPGVGETTRVLLRRVAWKILVKNFSEPNLKHILLLAKERGVEVEQFQEMSYLCCGLIKKADS